MQSSSATWLQDPPPSLTWEAGTHSMLCSCMISVSSKYQQEHVQVELEGVGYYQGTYSVEQYIDSFKDFLAQAGYTDKQMLIMKFCQGLKPFLDT